MSNSGVEWKFVLLTNWQFDQEYKADQVLVAKQSNLGEIFFIISRFRHTKF